MIHRQIIEIKSPGPLISIFTIKKLYELEEVHELKNALIDRVFYKYKWMIVSLKIHYLEKIKLILYLLRHSMRMNDYL